MNARMLARMTAGLSLLAALLGTVAVEGSSLVRLVETETCTIEVEFVTDVTTLGGEIALRFPGSVVEAVAVEKGPDFPAGDGEVYFDLDPKDSCPADGNLDAGIAVAWIFSADGSAALAPGTYRLLTLQFRRAPGSPSGPCSLTFAAGCLGASEAPVRNVVTGESGRSIPLSTEDGEFCAELPFVRGDANADGKVNISDPIGILNDLFLGTYHLPCRKAADATDDGKVDITDAVHLLRSLFAGAAPPPAPYPDCGFDPTLDVLTCESFSPCN